MFSYKRVQQAQLFILTCFALQQIDMMTNQIVLALTVDRAPRHYLCKAFSILVEKIRVVS